DFAIEGDRPAASLGRHRLSAERTRIDDGKAPVAERDPPIGRRPKAVAVRTSAPLQLAQTRDDGHVVNVSVGAEAERACYCAHFRNSPKSIEFTCVVMLICEPETSYSKLPQSG